ncbi:MAG: carotenoid biosynthesis protein, partial [Thermomicrobium sp.]|nr:carotenoid biosynthesis protein [Thermomicrobium sp.]
MRLARLSWIFYLAYVFALAFGVAGIGIALRRPELWAHLEAGRVVYAFGMQWGGVLYIVLGAAAMLSFALATLGSRRALSFFVLSTSISLGAELIGTSTGWPFGNYAYTSGLGPKILDRVPFTIPLSWFTVGLASWLFAAQIGARWFRTTRPEVTIPLGVWLLVVWDLVLDPAMAHEAMQARFWVWHQTGSYYGMPVINFVGWALTGFAFVTASRLAWRSDPPVSQSPL